MALSATDRVATIMKRSGVQTEEAFVLDRIHLCDSERLVDEGEGGAATFDGKGESKRGNCEILAEREVYDEEEIRKRTKEAR